MQILRFALFASYHVRKQYHCLSRRYLTFPRECSCVFLKCQTFVAVKAQSFSNQAKRLCLTKWRWNMLQKVKQFHNVYVHRHRNHKILFVRKQMFWERFKQIWATKTKCFWHLKFQLSFLSKHQVSPWQHSAIGSTNVVNLRTLQTVQFAVQRNQLKIAVRMWWLG